MKNKLSFASALLAAFMVTSMPLAESKMVQGTMKGLLSDSMCKGDHAGMIKMGGYGTTAVSCSQKCLKEGNSLVFVNSKTKAVYTLQNPGTAKKYAGKTVTISGHIDNASKVIHVHRVK